jgi:tetratricopeptide (TPR) repeat protein
MSKKKVKTDSIEEIESRIDTFEDPVNLIKQFIKDHYTDSFEDIERLFNWHKRTKNIKQGLKVLDIHKFPSGEIDTSFSLGQRAFYASVLLNMRGAGSFAVRLLEGASISRPSEFHYLGGVYFTNGYFEKGIELYKKALGDLSCESYKKRRVCFHNIILGHIYLGEHSKACEYIEILAGFDDEIAKSKINFWRGLNESMKGDFQKGLTYFESQRQAKSTLGKKFLKTAMFTGFYLYTKLKLGIFDQSENEMEEYLELEFRQLENGFSRVESFIFILDFLRKEYIFDKKLISAVDCYPSTDFYNYHFRNLKSLMSIGNPDQCEISIYLAKGEFIERGVPSHFLPKEVELLSYIRRAGVLGISKVRLFELLWSDDICGHFLHGDRLRKLFKRVESKLGIKIEAQGEWVKMCEKEQNKIFVSWDESDSVPLFLNDLDSFELSELMSFYHIKKSSAYKLISTWSETGLIVKALYQNKTIFRVVRDERISS